MFGMFKRKSPDKWKVILKEFSEITQSVRSEGIAAQMAVGHGINMANSLFVKSFSDINSFVKNIPDVDRVEYIKKLGMTVENLSSVDP